MRLRSRRPGLMTPMRWVVLVVTLLLLAFLIFNLWYRSIHAEVWAEEREAAQRASEAAQLTEIDRIDKHVWNTTTWIVQGRDTADQQLMVWLHDDKVEIIGAADGITEEDLKRQLASDHPEQQIVRIMPGLLNGVKAWEVYYSVEGSPRRFFYSFYRFDNGQFITTYNLPNRFAEGSITDEDNLP